MTVQEFLRVVREQWLLIVAAALIGLAVGGAVAWDKPADRYAAHTTLFVSAVSGSSSADAAQRAESYAQLVSTARVGQAVVDLLGLQGVPAAAVSGSVTAERRPGTSLIDVHAFGSSPQQVAAIANAVADVFGDVAKDIDGLSTAPIVTPADPAAVVNAGPPEPTVNVVNPAVVPTKALPADSRGKKVAFGLVIGLAVGLAGALTRNAMDYTVKSAERLREAAQAPNLGTIGFDRKIPKRPLTIHEDLQSPRTEAFRQLRTNVQFVDVDNPHKVIVVTSPSSFEGKTTTATNLVIAMASAGNKVLLIDADLRRAKIADLLGIEGSIGLSSVLSGGVRAEQAVQHWSGGGFDVLASGVLPPNPSEMLGSKRMRDLLTELRERYDVILLDTPPVLPVTDAAAVAPATDGAILACRFNETTTTQVRAAVQALSATSTPVLGTVFTMVRSNRIERYQRKDNDPRLEPAPLRSERMEAELAASQRSQGGRNL